MSHLTDEQLSALRDGALEGAALERARRHLSACAECREALATLEQMDAALTRSLAHDPGDRYFESFAARVTERIAAEDRAATAPRRGARPGMWTWLLSPQGLGLAGSAAAVLVVGALVYFQNQRGSDLRPAELANRSQQVAPERSDQLPERSDQLQEERSDQLQEGRSDGRQKEQGGKQAQRDELRSVPGDAARSDDARNAAPREAASSTLEQERRQTPPASPSAPGAAQGPLSEQTANEFAPAPKQEAGAPALEKKRAATEGAPTSTAPLAATPAPPAGARVGAPAGAMTRVERTPRGEEVPATKQKLGGASRESAPVLSGSSGPVALKPDAPVMSGRSADSAMRLDASRQSATAAREARDRAELDADESGLVRICGRVTDGQGRAVSGAEVAIADVGRSVTADAEGRFCVTSPPGEHTVSVLRVGYEPLRQTITAGATSDPMTLALRPVPVLQSRESGAYGFSQEPKSGSTPGVAWTGSWPAPVQQDVALAEATAELAARTRSAARYEDAARVWERVLTRLGSPGAQLEARDRIGESRWLAWQLDRSAARAANARTALTAFLAKSPKGARADLARERLAALGR